METALVCIALLLVAVSGPVQTLAAAEGASLGTILSVCPDSSYSCDSPMSMAIPNQAQCASFSLKFAEYFSSYKLFWNAYDGNSEHTICTSVVLWTKPGCKGNFFSIDMPSQYLKPASETEDGVATVAGSALHGPAQTYASVSSVSCAAYAQVSGPRSPPKSSGNDVGNGLDTVADLKDATMGTTLFSCPDEDFACEEPARMVVPGRFVNSCSKLPTPDNFGSYKIMWNDFDGNSRHVLCTAVVFWSGEDCTGDYNFIDMPSKLYAGSSEDDIIAAGQKFGPTKTFASVGSMSCGGFISSAGPQTKASDVDEPAAGDDGSSSASEKPSSGAQSEGTGAGDASTEPQTGAASDDGSSNAANVSQEGQQTSQAASQGGASAATRSGCSFWSSSGGGSSATGLLIAGGCLAAALGLLFAAYMVVLVYRKRTAAASAAAPLVGATKVAPVTASELDASVGAKESAKLIAGGEKTKDGDIVV